MGTVAEPEAAGPVPTPLVAVTVTVRVPPLVHSDCPEQLIGIEPEEVPLTVVEPETPPPDQDTA